jgi:hypothetical protein
MPETTYSLGPLWVAIRDELRESRMARATRREFRRRLPVARTPADLDLFSTR